MPIPNSHSLPPFTFSFGNHKFVLEVCESVSVCNKLICIIFFFFVFLSFLGPHPRHVEIPRLGVELELQLPAYATATAMQDTSHIYDLHHSSWQHRILNPVSEARDRICNLMVPRWIRFHCATMGTPRSVLNHKNMLHKSRLIFEFYVHIVIQLAQERKKKEN